MNGSDITLVPKMQETWEDYCAYCGAGIDEVAYTIHRDGPGIGPEVPLCKHCFTDWPTPTVTEIWAKIANPEPVIEAIKEVQRNEMRQMRQA